MDPSEDSAVSRILTCLEGALCEGGDVATNKSIAAAREMANDFLLASRRPSRDAQDETLRRLARTELVRPGRKERETAPLKRERHRAELLEKARPELMLAPANVVATFLKDNAMWKSWAWAEPADINSRMLPVVRHLDDLPDDPRLALPFTVAGFYIVRVLRSGPWPREQDLVQNTYYELADAVIVLDAVMEQAVTRKIDGEVSEDFIGHFAASVNSATLLLMHAVGVGTEKWQLVIQCPLGDRCRKQAPYFVTRPGQKDRHHGACRTAESRNRSNKTPHPPSEGRM